MKRLHDVAVRMRPRAPRSLDGVPQDAAGQGAEKAPLNTDAQDASGKGFSALGDGPRIPARSPFMPSSRDLARQAAQAADEHENRDAEFTAVETDDDVDADDLKQNATEDAGMTEDTGRSKHARPISRRQIWDLEADEVDTHDVITDRTYLPDAADDADEAEVAVDDAPEGEDGDGPDDMASRALRALEKAERQLEARGIPASALYEGEGAKTRVLGFHTPGLETDAISAVARKSAGDVRFPAGWIVVVEGPGRGAFFAVTNSVSSIGRGLDQTICLNFGDASISRNNHAALAYDAEQNRFFLGHGNKSNIVRRNGQPVLSTEELSDGDQIRIGKTTLRFVALCGPEFTWGPDLEEAPDVE